MQKSSELLGNSQEFQEILTNIQKILLKSSKDFKFSCETQGDSIKIEVLIQKGSVKTEDEGWISNKGNSTRYWSEGFGIVYSETLVEVIYRNGEKEKLIALDSPRWRETDGCGFDIVKFRIIK